MQSQLFIDGEWVSAKRGGTLPMINPVTEETVHHIPAGDAADADAAAHAFRAGFLWIDCAQPTFIEAPWGGRKPSGIGRQLGRCGLDNDLETNQITNYVSPEPWGWYLK